MKKVMIVLEVVILIGFVGCGEKKNAEKMIIGKWKQIDATQIIEFFEDGTVSIVDKGEPSLAGDYKFIDKKKIKMEFKGIGELFGAIIAEVSPSGDEITLTNPMGKIERYRRWGESTEKAEKETGKTYAEEERPRVSDITLVKEIPALKVVYSRGKFQIGDFSLALNSVERESSRANLHFAVTKVKNTGSEIGPIAMTLTDDHENNYYGTLDISPYDDFPLHLLPIDFTYIKTASITMPEVAPIDTIQLENTEKIAFKKLKIVKPQFKTDFGTALLRPGESTPVGEYLSFIINGIVPDLHTWAISITVKSKEYNELRAELRCAVQFTNGMIGPPEPSATITVPGLSKKTAYLKLNSLQSKTTPSLQTFYSELNSLQSKTAQNETTPNLQTLLIFYCDPSVGQTVLKLWPVSDRNLPLRVGQGANEDVFIEAYQRNGGKQTLGDPLGLPHWLAGSDKPKNGVDMLIQKFPNSLIIWDKQGHASKAYVLYGPVLEKYQEQEIYRNLGPPIDDIKSWESSFGTKGIYGSFKNGVITSRTGQTLVVIGTICKKWKEENFIRGPLGFPLSDEKVVNSSVHTGWIQRFEGGSICCITKGEQADKIFEIQGPIAKTYNEMGAEASWLGFPISGTYKSISQNPFDQIDFEGGFIGSRDGKNWEAFPYEKEKIAFVSNRDGNKEVYVMDANGRNQINLTNNSADDESPTWSPDGEKIAFESNRNGNQNIYIMDADGGNLKKLTESLSGDSAWFPDGLKIAYASIFEKKEKDYWGNYKNIKSCGIFVMDKDGSNQTLLWVPQKRSITGVADIAVSPNGKKIAFATLAPNPFHLEGDMWVINSDGSGKTHIDIGRYHPRGFSWSSSRNVIAFYLPQEWSKEPYEGKAIGLVSPDSGRVIWLTNKFGKEPCFSPDGKKIVFSNKGEICVINVSGNFGRNITKNTGGENWSPSWIDSEQKRKARAFSKKKSIPAKEISENPIPGKYLVTEFKKNTEARRSLGIRIFKKDGTMAFISSDSETVIPNLKWEFKNGAVQVYQNEIEESAESLSGKVQGDTIIFKTKDGELQYVKQK